jgi:hypothetical protein
MKFHPFKGEDLSVVTDALDISEDITGNFFKFSTGQWKRFRYDVKTLADLTSDEISEEAFAVLSRRTRVVTDYGPTSLKKDYYFICLQDHQVLKAIGRDGEIGLLPLLVYVLTHELVHIIRFSNFVKRYDVSGSDREMEERVVHSITYEILRKTNVPRLDRVLDRYRDHRWCEVAFS